MTGSTGEVVEEEEEGEGEDVREVVGGTHGSKVNFPPVKESESEVSEYFTVKVGAAGSAVSGGLQGTAEWQGEMATGHGSGSENTVPVS